MASAELSNGTRVHAIQTGTVAIKELQRNGGGRARSNLARVLLDRRWTEPLPILAWLIEHPEGLILVDTGETPEIAEPGYFTPWQPYFRLGLRERVERDDAIGVQIERLGHAPSDVRRVVLTHFHTDHAGGLRDLPDSTVLCSGKDYRLAQGVRGKARGFLPQHWPSDFAPTPVDLRDGPFGPFATSTTLTAAGDVHVVPTPGHTPGHLSVALEDGETVLFFAGDASYSQQFMLDGVVDGVTTDVGRARDSLARIRRLVAERPTVYLPTHDAQSVARLAGREVVAPGAPRPA